ncbi:MAG: hypothetical protein ACRDTA_22670 [Pseudonocardiaceae bacterium]
MEHVAVPLAAREGIGYGRRAQVRRTVACHEQAFTRLRAARLDSTLETEMRRLARVELLILHDFAPRPLDPTQTSDFYELIVDTAKQPPSAPQTENRSSG